MPGLFHFARENGWPEALARILGSSHRRLRDHVTARKLHCPGFRVGRHPRLLGLAHMHLGPRFTAGDGLWLEAITHYAGQSFSPSLTIGPGCSLSDRVHIACLSSITIGSGFLSGSGVLISDHGHGVYHGPSQSPPDTVPAERPLHSNAPIIIGNNVWLGDRVSVLAGATIGDGAIVGAGAIVTGNVPAATIVIGNPATPIRRWDEPTQQWQRL